MRGKELSGTIYQNVLSQCLDGEVETLYGQSVPFVGSNKVFTAHLLGNLLQMK